MKRIEKADQNKNVIFKTGTHQKNGRALFVMMLLTALFLLPISALAEVERYVLNFNDQYFDNHRGESTTLLLKRSLKQQYPWVDTRNLKLKNVILVAKSKVGRGYVQLRVGPNTSNHYRIAGHPKRFNRDHRKSFDRVHLYNPSRTSRGPWQISLNGNFKLRKIILITEDNRYHKRDYYSWH